MGLATLAWTIKSWVALMMHRKTDRGLHLRLAFHRFVRSMSLITCRGGASRAWHQPIRSIGYRPTLQGLFSA